MNDEVQQELIKSLLKEKRSDRRWRNIRSIIWAIIIFLLVILIFGPRIAKKAMPYPYAAVVRLNGEILPTSEFSVRYALPVIQQAFQDKAAKGVILLINSPGGAAAQASILRDRILSLKQQYHKKVVVVAEDALASGAYLVATSADKIFVNRDTLTGSIGVVMSGFGFVDAMQKLGITRRVFTAGKNKDDFDPFLNVTPDQEEKIKKILSQVHQSFIQDVKFARGKRLVGDDATLFSGDFWNGETAVKLGFADKTADLWTVMNQEFGVSHIKEYQIQPSIFSSLVKNVTTELKVGILDKNSILSEKAF